MREGITDGGQRERTGEKFGNVQEEPRLFPGSLVSSFGSFLECWL